MKRKSIALLLALVTCLGLTVPAFADYSHTLGGITITATDTTLSYTGTGALTEEHLLIGVEVVGTSAKGKVVTINIAPGITGVPDVS